MAVTPSIDPSIKVIKSFSYRGAVRLFSNRYHFDNLQPADATKWQTLSDAVVTAEKAIYLPRITIVGTYGYDAGSEVPVYSKTYSTVGTGSWTTAGYAPGDACALCRWSTAQRSTKNHPIYLYSYWHGVEHANTTNADDVNALQLAAMQTYATAWVTGFSDGAVTHHRCGPQGHTATGQYVHPKIHHRDFL